MQLINLLRGGSHPFELLGVPEVTTQRISLALGRLITGWHPLYGSVALGGGTAQDIFVALIRLIPLTRPEAWKGQFRALDLLQM